MSIDPVTLSAYLDGEVPERFHDEIRQELESNPRAALMHDRFAGLQRKLPRLPDERVHASAARSWQKLQRPVPAALPSLWRRSVSLPLPALAGVAAVLVAILGLGLWSLIPGRQDARDHLTAGGDVDVTIRVDGSNMEDVLQWLVDQNMLGEVNIQLPEQRFQIVGEPVLLKPDYIPEVVEE